MILVVDDHLEIGQLLARVLQYKCSDEAMAVDSGRAALKLIRDLRPSLIILDVMMPEMDGLEVLRQIRSDLVGQAVPVIMYSADPSSTRQAEALRLGAQEFLVKAGVSCETLCSTVEKYLAH